MSQEDLLKGSIDGIPFNFTESAVTDGGSTIVHSYVNSDNVDQEEVGKPPRSFNMNIYVHGVGREYYRNRDSMEAILSRGAGKDLVHPTQGKLYVVVDGPYTLNESIAEIGIAPISVKFTVIDRVGFVRSKVTPQKVFNQAEFIATLNSAKFGPEYGISTLSAMQQAQKFVKDLAAGFKKAEGLINDPTKLGEFTSQLLGFEKGNFTSGVDLARDIFDLYGATYGFITTAKSRFDFFAGLFGFGDDAPTIPQTTRTRVEQANNQVLQAMITQSNALVYATAASVEIEYQTEDELNNTNIVIQAQFQKILNDDITTSEQYTELQSIRVNFTEITKSLALDVSRIIEIEVFNTGLSTLIYQYYGMTEGTEEFELIYSLIISLNGLEETGGITGTLKIITQQGAL
ncbi:MAG: hypothetical protein DRH97_00150 [Chloroflexi bacterium]|nr:MAG: hypothetical protein DRH97_00150 [Chloroflexota bacterium]